MEETVKYLKDQLNDSTERSGHLTKRLNRLGSWGFFKVLYRDAFFKLFLINILMLLCLIPAGIALYGQQAQLSALSASLPTHNGLGLGIGVWQGVSSYYDASATEVMMQYNAYIGLGLLVACVAISGCMGVIRDAFWTGKVTVFKSFWYGIKSSVGYSVIGIAVLFGVYFGLFALNVALAHIKWLAILLTILGGIVALLLVMYVLIVCAVATTYKLSVKDTLASARKLLFLNIVPNIFNLLIAVLPILLFIVAKSSYFISMLLLAFFFMLGFFYIVFVYMTHMMRTFILFNPVQSKKNA